MSDYGQFCSVARAQEILGGRWTLLIVRELLCGSRRFNQIRRGIPRVSPTLLSERLDALVAVGAVARVDGRSGPEYELTQAGQELSSVVGALATWGQRWLERDAQAEDLDLHPLLWDMHRRVRREALPQNPIVIRFDIRGKRPRFMLLTSSEVSLCGQNPGFPEAVIVKGPLSALVAWWRGDVDFQSAQRAGLALEGGRSVTRAFPRWFDRYMFASVRSVLR